MVDAWIREAEEASRLMEDLECRIKNKNPEQQSLGHIALSKLLELGVKLDRLESLLHNPPSKPILYPIKNKSSGSQSLCYTIHRPRSLPAEDTKEATRTANSYDQDHTKVTFSKEDPELLTPLVSDDATRSQLQTKLCSSFSSKSWIWKACWVIFVILGAAVLLLVLVIICAVL